MRPPESWLAQQVAGRPDDFSDDDLHAALKFIRDIQRDARASSEWPLLFVYVLVVVQTMTVIAAIVTIVSLIHGRP